MSTRLRSLSGVCWTLQTVTLLLDSPPVDSLSVSRGHMSKILLKSVDFSWCYSKSGLLWDIHCVPQKTVVRNFGDNFVKSLPISKSLRNFQQTMCNNSHHILVSNCCISQGSVATYLRCGGNYYTRFVGNFFLFTAVQEFLKSVKVWQIYHQSSGPQFLWGHSVV